MSHANARLTPTGRLLLVQRIEAGMPQAEVARQMRLSRGTVAKWWHRWCEHGEAGLVDRSSRPHRSPRRTAAGVEQRICRLRRSTRRGPVYLSARTGVPAATVWRILARNGLNRLAWIDRLVSGGREPPPPALLEPYVTVSRHTAPTVRRSSASVDLSVPPPKG